MGGSLYTKNRLHKQDYQVIEQQVLEKLKSIFPNTRIAVPDGFLLKDSYGDLDILLGQTDIPEETIKEVFGLNKKGYKVANRITGENYYINSNVLSFGYNDFQVDLIFMAEQDFDSTLAYLRQSDTSNIVGQMARFSTGYRLTHRGLLYTVKLDDSHKLGEILVSKDRKSIHEFLDLDHQQWENGFDDKEQMFAWISNSRYFNKDCFAFESLKHEDRTRNRKRSTYAAFVNWLIVNEFNNHYIPENKQEHLFRGNLHFYEESGFWIGQAEDLVRHHYEVKKAANIFNATDITKITGKTGAELGKIKRDFNSYLDMTYDLESDKEQVHFIAHQTKEKMYYIFNKFYLTYSESDV